MTPQTTTTPPTQTVQVTSTMTSSMRKTGSMKKMRAPWRVQALALFLTEGVREAQKARVRPENAITTHSEKVALGDLGRERTRVLHPSYANHTYRPGACDACKQSKVRPRSLPRMSRLSFFPGKMRF